MSSIALRRTGLLAGLCAVLTATAGLATSAASSSPHHTSRHATRDTTTATPTWGGPGFGGPPIHSVQVALNKAGTGYETVTLDSGTVSAVDGDQLAVAEGTKSVPYATIKLTIDSGATITRNGSAAALSDLKAGDFVLVQHSNDGTFVLAGDGSATGHFPGGWGGGPPTGLGGRPAGFGPFGFGR